MAPPNGVSPAGRREVPPPNPADERQDLLSSEKLVTDERWGDPSFRTQQHLELYLALKALDKFMAGEIPVEKLLSKIEAWTGRASFDDPANQEFNQAVVDKLHAQLRLFRTDVNSARATQVADLLPDESPPAEEPAKPKEPKKKEAPEEGEAKKSEKVEPRYLSGGLELDNDTVGYFLLKDVFSINPDAVLREKYDFRLKGSATFKAGPLKLMGRLSGGVFSSQALPGTEVGEVGKGWMLEADIGVSNPWGENFNASGGGVERTVISSHAGKGEGVKTPGPVYRLHFFRQEDWTLHSGKKLQFGVNTFLNNQETYFVLGGNDQLVEGGGSDFSTAGNLFVRNKINLLGVSLRFYPKGAPQNGSDKYEDDIKKEEFRSGEAWPKISNVFVGTMINRNRRRDMPPFANNMVFNGTFEPFGPSESLRQYKLLATGLQINTFLDGWSAAGNVNDRSEIWRRGNLTEVGVSLALDAANFITDGIIMSQAKADPPLGQEVEDFAANPGSVPDFEPRAARINIWSNAFELGLSGADALGAFGRDYDENKLHYGLTHLGLLLAGIPLYFHSARVNGLECADEGTPLFRCGLGTTANTQGHYFSEDTFDVGPADIRKIEDMSITSIIGSTLMVKGGEGVFNSILSLFEDEKPKDNESAEENVRGRQSATVTDVGLSVGPGGGMATVKIKW